MSVSIRDGVARLDAPSRVEDAEPLWRFLCAERAAGRLAVVDPSGAGLPHAAVAQLLLLFRPRLRAGFDAPFARHWLQPLLGPVDPDGPAA